MAETLNTHENGNFDNRVLPPVILNWINSSIELPKTEDWLILLIEEDGKQMILPGWYSQVKNVFYAGAYSRNVTHWMSLPCLPL